ncbi:MAG: response regulator [Pseudomonadales bacterium]|nr:response regulator [Pseudomonadales bacterium]
MLSTARESIRDKTVLVVDDSKMIRVTTQKSLLKAGFDVVLATDGLDALSKIVESRPSLIILDIMMPEIDGYETCSLIKQHRDFSDIPVIMLSGKNSRFDQSRSKLAGFDQCLTKPFSEHSLISAINQVSAVEQVAAMN